MPQIEIKWTTGWFRLNSILAIFFLRQLRPNDCNRLKRITFCSRKITHCAWRIVEINKKKVCWIVVARPHWTFQFETTNRLRHATKIVQIKIIFHVDFYPFCGILQFDPNARPQWYWPISRWISIAQYATRTDHHRSEVLSRLNALKWNALLGLGLMIAFRSSRDECQFKSFAVRIDRNDSTENCIPHSRYELSTVN